MTDPVLLARCQLGKCTLLPIRDEERIVTETVDAFGQLTCNRPLAPPLPLPGDRTIPNNDDRAHEGGPPILHPFEPFEEERIVLRIRRTFASEARRAHSGFTTERFDDQSAIVGEHPFARTRSGLQRLSSRILKEGGSVLFDRRDIGSIGEGLDVKRESIEEAYELVDLLPVLRCDKKSLLHRSALLPNG